MNLNQIGKSNIKGTICFFCGFGRKSPASRFRSLHIGQVDVHVGQVQDLSVQKLNLKNNYWKLF